MSARFAGTLIALCALLILPTLRATAQTQNASIENEFIRLVVNNGPNEAGRFSIITTGGDPKLATSKNQQLIYGGNTPWTSFTTIRIDDANYVFGGPTDRRAGLGANYGTVVSGPKVTGDSIVTACQFGDIVVTQELGFSRGMQSRMLDTASITYRISNQGKAPHQVGIRVLLDTKLGPNDGAPVRVGTNAIKTATDISGEKLADYWQAFDKFPDCSVVSQGTYKDSGLTVPDEVIFADWGTLADDVWQPQLDPTQGFVRKGEDEDDTATALFWNPVSVEPGKSVSYTTAYGVGYLNVIPAKLSLGITAPAETTFEYERTQPITVTGYLQNSGDFEARNVKLSLKLPAGLTLAGGSKATETIESMKPGDEVAASWVVLANGKAGGKQSIHVEVTSENIESNAANWDIQVNVPKPRLVLSPNAQRVPLKTNKRPTMVPISVNLTPSVDFYGASFTVSYDPKVMKPLLTYRGSALVEDGRLLDGWTYDDSEDGKLVITASRGDASRLTQAEINLVSITFRVVGEGICPLTLDTAVLINEKGEESPVATSAGQVEVKSEPAQ